MGRPRLDKYVTQEERMRFLVAFLKRAELIEVTEAITDCRDEKDNKILELAVSGRITSSAATTTCWCSGHTARW